MQDQYAIITVHKEPFLLTYWSEAPFLSNQVQALTVDETFQYLVTFGFIVSC